MYYQKQAEEKCLNKFTTVDIKLIDLNDFSNNLVMTEKESKSEKKPFKFDLIKDFIIHNIFIQWNCKNTQFITH